MRHSSGDSRKIRQGCRENLVAETSACPFATIVRQQHKDGASVSEVTHSIKIWTIRFTRFSEGFCRIDRFSPRFSDALRGDPDRNCYHCQVHVRLKIKRKFPLREENV